MTTTRRAAIYARVSTEEQTRGIVPALGTQVERCQEKAAVLRIPVIEDLVIEEQHSGADLRWEGTKLMWLARQAEDRHVFTDLICLDIDRFCRGGSREFDKQMERFEQAGVTLHFVMFDIPAGTPFGQDMMRLVATAAQWQRDKSREASMRKREAIARAGYITAGRVPPWGFRWPEPQDGFPNDGMREGQGGAHVYAALHYDETTGPLLTELTRRAADGASMAQLKAWLEGEGIPAPSGIPRWGLGTIRRILKNSTNYGGRMSFVTKLVPRPEGTERTQKTKHAQPRRPEEEQIDVSAAFIVPPPGLTYDLWQRAVARLAENKALADRNARVPLEERVLRGLLLNGMARCEICGRALVLHKTGAALGRRWRYSCAHTDTPHESEPSVNVLAPRLDAVVWELAANCVRSPDYLARLAGATEEATGPTTRAIALRAQLADAEKERTNLMRRLARLDADDPTSDDYEQELRTNRALRDKLGAALGAAEAEAAGDEARAAVLSAWRAQAETEAPRLEDYTRLQKHHLLRTWLRARAWVGPRGTISVRFDVRGVPETLVSQNAFHWHHSDEGNLDGADSLTPFDWDKIPSLEVIVRDDTPIPPSRLFENRLGR